jgi:hypothetical protein
MQVQSNSQINRLAAALENLSRYFIILPADNRKSKDRKLWISAIAHHGSKL